MKNDILPFSIIRVTARLTAAAMVLLLAIGAPITARADGTVSINTGTGSGNGWSFSSPTLTITANGDYIITGTGAVTTNRIVVSSGVTANITLDNVNIDVSGTQYACAFNMTGATVNLTLAGDNTLKSGRYMAGLQVPTGATLVITAASTGSLVADGGPGILSGSYITGGSAGIGGQYNTSGGKITINGGTVNATGAYMSAGIGGGSRSSQYQGQLGVESVTVTGGTVIANGGMRNCTNANGPGIGGESGDVLISGGIVYATAPCSSTAIVGSNVTINGNTVVFSSSALASAVKTKGILFESNTGKMYGDVTLGQDVEFPTGKTLTVESGQTLTVSTGITLTNTATITNESTITNNGAVINNGTINNCNGIFTNNGTFSGTGIITCYVASSASGIVYVTDGGAGDMNGSSWANAYPNLAGPLLAAKTNTDIQQIWIAAGTYYPLHKAAATDNNSNPTTDRDKAFVLVPGLKIYGGFDGTETSIAQRPAFSGNTILSGDIGVTGDISDNCYHVIIGADIPANSGTILDGFTVTGGNANTGWRDITINGKSFDSSNGGGIYNNSSSLILTNVAINGNASSNIGGGMCNIDNSSPVLTNVAINGNSGSGMTNYNSSPILTNVAISGNSSEGIFNWNNCFPILTNVTISGNIRGIYNINSSLSIINSIIWGNGDSGYDNVLNNNSTPTYQYSIVQGRNTCGMDTYNNFDVDPKFVNWIDPAQNGWTPTTAGDYRLRQGSPAVNTADSTLYATARGFTQQSDWTTETDLAGNLRLQGGRLDMGAYELSDNKITPDAGTVTIASPVVYGATLAPTLAACARNPVNADTAFIYSTSQNGAYSATAPQNAGTYYVKGVLVENALQYADTTAAVQFTIVPDTVAVVWSDTTFVYDRQPHYPTATATGISAYNIPLALSDSTATNVNTYQVTATTADGNYYLTNTTFTFHIVTNIVTVIWADTTFVYDGNSHIPTVTNAAPPVITVSGSQTDVGTYTATASTTDAKYYLTNTTFTFYIVSDAPITPVINRQVTLRPVEGAITNPSADTYRIISGSDFTFTLTPSSAGLVPTVYTNRAIEGKPETLIAKPNSDGSYTFIVRQIHQNIEIGITMSTGNDEIAQARALKASVVNGRLYVAGLTQGKTWSVYDLLGKLTYRSVADDSKVEIALPTRGIYIVVSEGQSVKVAY